MLFWGVLLFRRKRMSDTNKSSFNTVKSYLVEITFKFDTNSIIILQTLVKGLSPRDCLGFALEKALPFIGNRGVHYITGKLVYNYRFTKIYAYNNEGKLVGIYNNTKFKDLASHISKVEILGEYDDNDSLPNNLGDRVYTDPGIRTVRYKEVLHAD